MKPFLQITRAFTFLLLTLFASSAWSVTVNSEFGGASLDGTWAHGGCSEPDFEDDPPEEQFDQEEFLIFEDKTVEVRLVLYPSIDGSCSGIGNAESEVFNFTEEDDLQTLGWFGDDGSEEGGPVPPPPRQDGSGPLAAEPLATVHAILIPGEDGEEDQIETKYWYIDDTGLNWFLYFNAGEDDAPIPYMDAEEWLTKTDQDIGVIPVPAGIWLFGTALIGFVGYSRRRKIG